MTVVDLNNLTFSELFELTKNNRTRANHSFKLFTKSARGRNLNKYSFFVRIVHDWNRPPQQVVEAGTFKLFKARLICIF